MEATDTLAKLRRTIAAALDEGLSMRTALDAYRAFGGAIRTEDFAAIWRDEQRKRESSAA